ncbi:MAG: phosphoenolpyruvate mutase, partial [Clostridia bacterium]
ARGSVMAVDSSLPLPQKDFKAQLREGRIVAVGVDRFGADCVTCQPAYKWLAADFARWLDALAAFVARGERGVYAENAFNAEDGAIPLWPMELCGRLCGEIDNPDDLRQISARFETLLPNC